jgi:hypothetical protein
MVAHSMAVGTFFTPEIFAAPYIIISGYFGHMFLSYILLLSASESQALSWS